MHTKLLSFLVLTTALPASIAAQGISTSWGAEADFNSRYLWRGIAYSHGPVFQPAFWVTRGRTTVSVWSNMVLNNERGRGRFDQVFFAATREYATGRWKIESTLQGYYWQGFAGELNAKTLELSFRASRPVGQLRFITSHTVDIGSFRGSFVADAGFEGKKHFHGLEWGANGIAVYANATFNSNYLGVRRRALNYAQWGLAVTMRSSRGWFLRPHAELIVQLAAPARNAVDPTSLFNAGITIGRGL